MLTAHQFELSLFSLEKLSAEAQFKKLEKELIKILEHLEKYRTLESTSGLSDDKGGTTVYGGLRPFSASKSLNERLDSYSRLAVIFTQILSASSYQCSDAFLVNCLIHKSVLSEVFYLSCFKSMDHILINNGLMDEVYKLNLKNEQDIKLLYACITLNSNISYDTSQLISAMPIWGLYWYLGMIYGYQHPYNERMEQSYNALFDHHELLKTIPFDETAIGMIPVPWMQCSYLDRPDRHGLKVSFNNAVERWLESRLKKQKLDTRYIDDQGPIKRIAVLSEQYTSGHAMYRCYHTEIKTLKQRYHVTLVTEKHTYDDNSALDFDEVVEIDGSIGDISNTAKAIANLKPDLIYFPSLGMGKWTVLLANIRLARHQVMSYGHPASALSHHIDFAFLSSVPKDNSVDFQQYCLEKIVPIELGNDWKWQPHRELNKVAFDQAKPNDGVIRIAVNSSLPKITARFIKLCTLVSAHSSVPVQFHFFMITKTDAFEKSLLERIGSNVVVHPPADYPAYMANLAKCDLAIGTFPFGGSNTNVDLTLLNIPKIFYSEFSDMASYSDQTALEKLELPKILKPENESELLANVIYLVHDHKLRNQLSRDIAQAAPLELFFEENTANSVYQSKRFLDAVNWIENHEH